MIVSVILTMFGYWVLLGFMVALVMMLGLYFARACEFLVDFFFIKNKTHT